MLSGEADVPWGLHRHILEINKCQGKGRPEPQLKKEEEASWGCTTCHSGPFGPCGRGAWTDTDPRPGVGGQPVSRARHWWLHGDRAKHLLFCKDSLAKNHRAECYICSGMLGRVQRPGAELPSERYIGDRETTLTTPCLLLG
jgi:hypothetical protein